MALVLTAVPIDLPLGDPGHLQLGHPRLDLGQDGVDGFFADLERFFHTGDFGVAFDGTQADQGVVGPDQFDVGELLFQTHVYWQGRDRIADKAELLDRFPRQNLGQDVAIIRHFDAGIFRIGAFAVLDHLLDVRDEAASLGVFFAFGADQKDGVSFGRHHDRSTLERGPILGQVAHTGTIGFVAMHQRRVQARGPDIGLKSPESFGIFVDGNPHHDLTPRICFGSGGSCRAGKPGSPAACRGLFAPKATPVHVSLSGSAPPDRKAATGSTKLLILYGMPSVNHEFGSLPCLVGIYPPGRFHLPRS